jgi:hypothetical protein
LAGVRWLAGARHELLRKNLFGEKIDCTKLVQRARTPVFTGRFESLRGLFHTVFNKTVENFYQNFMKRDAPRDKSG